MDAFTHVVKPLDVSSIRHESTLFPLFGSSHSSNEQYKQYGSLRFCQTIWVKRLAQVTWHPAFMQTRSYLEAIATELGFKPFFGRVYYTLLPAGRPIVAHHDRGDYFDTINRYQIYFDWVPEQQIIQENAVIASDSLVWFNHKLQHGYQNDSDKDMVLLVFDIYKNPI